jgi:hypothetical protein
MIRIYIDSSYKGPIDTFLLSLRSKDNLIMPNIIHNTLNNEPMNVSMGLDSITGQWYFEFGTQDDITLFNLRWG